MSMKLWNGWDILFLTKFSSFEIRQGSYTNDFLGLLALEFGKGTYINFY